MEFDLGAVAGVSDRGRVRARNEDALAAAVLLPGTVVAIVCDGVGSAERADEAAQLAADTALDRIVDCLMAGKAARESVVDGYAAAFDAVRGLAQPVSVDLAPSCTFVAAVVTHDVTVGWVGDSRAYWLAGKRCQQLTVDDTPHARLLAAGLSEREASAAVNAHALSRWVGADAEPGPPNVTTLAVGEPGVLLLCSDGLWNHVPRPVLPAGPAALVAAALELGGEDNITAVTVPYPTPGSETP